MGAFKGTLMIYVKTPTVNIIGDYAYMMNGRIERDIDDIG